MPRRGSCALPVAVVLLVTAACTRAPSELQWTEDVRLSDGRTIVVARSVGIRSDKYVGGPTEIATTASQVQPIDPPGLFPPWSAPLIVQLLDYSSATGEWVLIADADSCESWAAIGRPPYSTRVMFVARDSGWVMQPMTEEFLGRKANMLVRVRQSQSYSGQRVTVEGKATSNRGAAPEALLMTPTPGAAADCSSYTKIS